MLIRHLIHKEIDKAKWDACISNAANPVVYACSWYLDVVSPGWEALVCEDYSYIMPLPVKRRLGFTYYIQPKFTQQLGIFSSKPVEDDIIRDFSLVLYRSPFISLSVNFRPSEDEGIKLNEFPNYILNLNLGYDELRKSFSKNTKRNTQKVQEENLIVKKITRGDFFSFYKKYGFFEDEIALLCQLTEKNEKVFLFYGVYDKTDSLLAANAFLYDFDRYINLLPVSSPEGMQQSAMFLLLDAFIKEKSGSSAILDFEGSRIEGIARFYKGFGATNEPYYYVQKGKMNLLFRGMKKLKNIIKP